MARKSSTGDSLVDVPEVKECTLLKERPLLSRGDVLPPLLMHVVVIVAMVSSGTPSSWEMKAVVLVTSLLLHILAVLSTTWWVRVRATLHMSVVSPADITDVATHAAVYPRQYRGTAEIVKLKKGEAGVGVSFLYQEMRFVWHSKDSVFRPLPFPVNGTLASYYSSPGSVNPEDLVLYGGNSLRIPVPSLKQLMTDQLTAPFFVFQLFCLALWCLEDTIMYSLITLGMLTMFEGTVAFSRRTNLKELRGMGPPTTQVFVWRSGEWMRLPSTRLIPGDVVSVAPSRSGAPAVCPADCVLLEGSAVMNEAMLTGESTPLVKESLHQHLQWKSGETSLLSLRTDSLHLLYSGTKVIKVTAPEAASDSAASTSASTTKAVTTTSTSEEEESNPFADYTSGSTGWCGDLDPKANSGKGIPRAPDAGVCAFVMRTGFHTSQGDLMRTILFSKDRVAANSEAGWFIAFLMIFAVAAAGYVWDAGVKREDTAMHKLVIECLLILTAVIPPELPLELTMAVNSSLRALQLLAVFCTEPFRIPEAGKVDVCCFDKTGTLTDEKLSFKGIETLASVPGSSVISEGSDLAPWTSRIIGGCHSLTMLSGTAVGDPLEVCGVEAASWTVSSGAVEGSILSSSSTHGSVTSIHRYHFSSELKRMSVIARVTPIASSGEESGLYVLCKGAPEVLSPLLSSIPEGYEKLMDHHAWRGARIIALAWRKLSAEESRSVKSDSGALERKVAEKGLEFAGFALFSSPIKKDSARAIAMLRSSDHLLSMITGDTALTAVYAAKALQMVTRDVVVAEVRELKGAPSSVAWMTVEGREVGRGAEEGKDLGELFDLVLTGAALDAFLRESGHADATATEISEESISGRTVAEVTHGWLDSVRVFARTSPAHKEALLAAYRVNGHTTLMCGDGTNDVGALKEADVGVALLSPDSAEAVDLKEGESSDAATIKKKVMMAARKKSRKNRDEKMKEFREKMERARAEAKAQSEGRPLPPRPKPKKGAKAASTTEGASGILEQLEKTMNDAGGESQESAEPATVRFGDASVAAPFTARIASIMPVTHIVRQGRCALVTTLQMYKILALNCLISAFSLSVLYVNGVKYGDKQMTAPSILISLCFMFITRSSPLEKLSPLRPPSRVFSKYTMTSILGQFAVHLFTIISAMQLSHEAMGGAPDPTTIDLKAEFSPNLLNSVVFVVGNAMRFATFFTNYRGHPWMNSLGEHRPLLYSLLATGAISLFCAMEYEPELNEYLEMVPFPTPEFRNSVVALILGNWGMTYAVERTADYFFGCQAPRQTNLPTWEEALATVALEEDEDATVEEISAASNASPDTLRRRK